MAIRGATRHSQWAMESLALGRSVRRMTMSLPRKQAAPAPNSPYMIFDREAKRMQRSRAALRRPVSVLHRRAVLLLRLAIGTTGF